jgi:hypothetical protein
MNFNFIFNMIVRTRGCGRQQVEKAKVNGVQPGPRLKNKSGILGRHFGV